MSDKDETRTIKFLRRPSGVSVAKFTEFKPYELRPVDGVENAFTIVDDIGVRRYAKIERRED